MSSSGRMLRMAIAEQAAAWFVANRERDAEDGDDAAFAVWLKTSALHVEEYLAMTLLARSLPRAAAEPDVALQELLAQARVAALPIERIAPRAAGRGGRWRRRWPGIAAAAALLLALAIGVFRPGAERIEPVRYATRHGGLASERLADGSVIRLDTDTAVSVRYGARERSVEVERGQVQFEVVHEAARPFRVVAGHAELLDIGTTFDVYRREESTLVTVVEGALRVWLRDGRVAAAAAPVRVSAGEQVLVSADRPPTRVSPVDLNRATGWLRRELSFERAPLAEVAAEFNRYGAVPIVIEGDALRSLAISGVFVADDTETFVAFLRSLDGVRIEVTPSAIRVTKG